MSDNSTQTVNKLRRDLLGIVGGTVFHAGADTAVSTANATDLPSVITLTNALATSFNSHVANLVDATAGTGVHGADSGHRITGSGVTATDLGSARFVLNELETKLQAHAASTPAHFSPQRLTAPYFEMSGTLSEACAHANALKAQLNAHYAAAMNAQVAA